MTQSAKRLRSPGREGCLGLAEIALELGVSKERVRQIEREAIRKLRRLHRLGVWPVLDSLIAEIDK